MADRQGIHCQRRLRILVDMDMVMCDFEAQLLINFKSKYPNEPFIPLEERRGFYARDQYAKIRPDLADKVRGIYNSKGFLRGLPELPGAVNAVKEMSQMEDIDVFICTAPLNSYKFCLEEKFAWIEEHLGEDWLDKIIITKDKTVVNGHVLIDDRPNIKGAVKKPTWEHVLFSACHNRDVNPKGKRLDNWTDGSWRDLVLDFRKKI